MDPSTPPFSFGNVAAPLVAAFGKRLTSVRSENSVHWSCGDLSAIVALRPNGTLEATFVAAEVDGVSGRPVAAVYRSEGNGYALRPRDCERMVSDMLAFFSGIREPRFAFIDAFVDRALATAR